MVFARLRTGIDKHWPVILGTVAVFALSLILRFSSYEGRAWFEGDHSKELLYAFNIVRDRRPLIISMVTSGSNIPNLPHFINFLAFVMWTVGNNPYLTMRIITAIAATVPPMLFLWGVIEGTWLGGLIAAVLFAAMPGAIEMANVWGNFVAFVPAVAGVVLMRYAIKRNSSIYRANAYISLCIAGALHYSHLGLLGAIFVVEAIRTRNIRRILTDGIICLGVLILLFLPTAIALQSEQQLVMPQVRYSHNMCRLCWQKIPELTNSFLYWFYFILTKRQFALIALKFLTVVTVILGLMRWKKILAWAVWVPLLFYVFAWIGGGQPAFWYMYPLLPFMFFLTGQSLANGIYHKSRAVSIISVLTVFSYLGLIWWSYGEYFSTISRIQKPIKAVAVVRQTMAERGILPFEYAEYATIDVHNNLELMHTTAMWLVRQYQYHELLTYNDPEHSYDPALFNPRPPYRVYVYGTCSGPADSPGKFWVNDGYVFDEEICRTVNDLRIEIYRKIR